MAPPKRQPVREEDLEGFRMLRPLQTLLAQLHGVGCDRDKAGNRDFFMDHYMVLLLLAMFNPICRSVHGLCQASSLGKVRRTLGVPRVSLGSFSEAGGVFDADAIKPLLASLACKVQLRKDAPGLAAFRDSLTAVDGTFFRDLPRVVQALWTDDDPPAFKAHVQDEILKGVAVDALVTDGRASEKRVLESRLQPGRLYVADQGYQKYALMQAILDADSSFIIRIAPTAVQRLVQDRPLTEAARAAGVRSDRIVWLGSRGRDQALRRPLRVLEVEVTEMTAKRLRARRKGLQPGDRLWIVTDRFDLDADLVALLYRQRGSIEIFFRMFKHLLGCSHLLSHQANGIQLQVYAAMLACLLIVLYTGRKPNRRTLEMVAWYLTGWASDAELRAHLDKLPPQA
jgi:hypothetical protein